MDTPKPRRQITWESTREEVLEIVEEHDLEMAEIMKKIREAEFPEVPAGFTGCVWSKDGTVKARYGKPTVNHSLEAQRRAGEEDQSVDSWDGA